MAVSFASVATTAFASSLNITINKPTGLAVGDEMIAHIVREGGSSGDISKTNWSLIAEYDDSELAAVLYKIADSSDVAASNFAFSTGGTAKCAGAIYRISNGAGSATTAGAFDTTSAQTTHTFDTSDLTPAFANSLLLILFHAYGGTAGSSSGYAIATSDPTWTEAYDLSDSGGTDMMLAGAYANRPETTSTGDVTVVTSSSTNGRCVVIAVPEKIDVTVTGSTGVLTLVGNAGTVTGTANVTGSTGVLTLTGNAGTVTTASSRVTNKNKNSASAIVNKNKS